MTNNLNDRLTIETLRADAATCLASKCPEIQQRGLDYLRMVEVLKVRLIAHGDRVTVTSKTGTTYRRAS